MNFTDLELLLIHTDVLFVHDKNHKLLRINEADADSPPPRFFLARSSAGNVWRVRHDIPTDLANELAKLAAAEPIPQYLNESPHYQTEYIKLLEQHEPVSEVEEGPTYYLPELSPPTHAVTITPENQHLLQVNFPYTLSTLMERSPVVVIVDQGAAVVACYTARSTPQAAEAGVYTEEAFRGRGFAADTVRGWAQAVRASGKLPLYSTSWENKASQAVAARLGAVQYGAEFSII